MYFDHTLLRARDWQDRPQFGRLCDWWRKGTAGVCALVGIGGAGKTAIAERFLRVLPGGLAEPDGIPKDDTLPQPSGPFVFSFYQVPNEDRFFAQLSAWLAGKALDESAKVPSYQQVLQDLAAVAFAAEKEGIPNAHSAGLLLVLDGLEKVQDAGARGGVFGRLLDGRLSDLVLRLAGGYLPGVRAIITTRFVMAELDQAFYAGQAPHYCPTPIEEISEETGVALLRKLKVRGADEDRRRIVRECGCHAMTVDLAGGYLAEFCEGNPDAPLELGTAEELEEAIADEADARRRAVLKQEHRFARIATRYREGLADRDPAALALMERVCLFRLGVDAATLASIFTGQGKKRISGPDLAKLKKRQLEQKLQKLAQMRLLEAAKRPAPKSKSKIYYSVHPAVREGFLAGLHPGTARSGHEAAREGLIASLGGLPGEGTNPSDAATLDLLEEIVHHTLEPGHVKEAFDIYWYRIGAFKNLGWRLGAYERGERICRAFADGHSPRTVLSTHRWEGKATGEAGYPFESLSDNDQIVFINGWAMYLADLGRLDAAADCYKQQIQMRMRQENWKGASIGNQNLADVWLLAGRLTAGLRAAEEALRLAELADKAQEREDSHAFRGHARALRGETQAALDDFRDALHWQQEDEAETDRPLYSVAGIWKAILLTRLGRNEEAKRLTERNKEILAEVIGTSYSIPKCNLILADLAREHGELVEALELQEQAHEWAIARDAKEVLCWSALVRARIQIAQTQSKKSKLKKEELLTGAARTLAEGLRFGRECGYGIFHIDLLAESARLHLLWGDPAAALGDLRLALDDGQHPPAESGYPELLAATDEQCLYAWGIAEGRHLRAEALLLQAAQTLGRPDFVPAKFDELPAQVRSLIESAREELKQSQKLREKIQDPKVSETNALLKSLKGGILTGSKLQKEHPMRRATIVELDLKGYSDVARELEDHLSAEIVMKFNDQIQGFVDAGLEAVGVTREQAVMATTGDGAILAFDQAEVGHRFGEAVHQACRVHNDGKTVTAARRWFRIGIATGDLATEVSEGTRKMAGSVIARAVRLEAAANIGEILVDAETYPALPAALQARFGSEELVRGKRDEKFQGRRCIVIPSLQSATSQAKPSVAPAPTMEGPLKTWREKLAYLEEQFAIASGAAQKFELKCQIEEAKDKIRELGG